MESGNGSSRRQKSPIPYVLPMACLTIALHGTLRLSPGGFEDGKERITARRQNACICIGEYAGSVQIRRDGKGKFFGAVIKQPVQRCRPVQPHTGYPTLVVEKLNGESPRIRHALY